MIPPVYQPLPYALSGLSFTQQVGIQISNIGSIAILWLVYMGYITEESCVLPFRAVQNHATALCRDLSGSGDCTLAHVLTGLYYTSFGFAIIGFVITYIDRRAGSAPKFCLDTQTPELQIDL
ncbi:hypothetical protein EDD22DRAFT_956535 [Suillus occidentalis]|nr:hypothetical protein EDD22DRAFT_956535 [Suillus occidentalis]